MANLEFSKHIRSFVKREGRLTAAQQRALQELWPRYGIEHRLSPLNPGELFQRNAPRVLEIGFGNGESLAAMAIAHPQIDFIGIEVHRPGVGHLLQLLDDHQLVNIRIICADAVEVLTDAIQERCFQQVSIFFPDPWPKQRHHKRRLIQSGFVSLLADRLCESGILHIATDWQNYAEHIQNVMSATTVFVAADAGAALPRPDTKYEQRGLRRGHRVFDLIYRRH